MQEEGCCRKHRRMAQSRQQSSHTQTQVHTPPTLLRSTVRCACRTASVPGPPVRCARDGPDRELCGCVPGSATTTRRRALGPTLHHLVLSSTLGSGRDCHWVTQEETEALMCPTPDSGTRRGRRHPEEGERLCWTEGA